MCDGGAVAIDPATGRVIEVFPWLNEIGRNKALDDAVLNFQVWRNLSIDQRALVLARVGAHFRSHSERFAFMMSAEMGKPIRQARAEVEKCAKLCDWYSLNSAAFISDELTTIEGGRAYVSFLQIGVVLRIMPWNFPYGRRCAVPFQLCLRETVSTTERAECNSISAEH